MGGLPANGGELQTSRADDTEWVNTMLVKHITGHGYTRIGVGQVSKYGWDS
jgi:hypothetical protein